MKTPFLLSLFFLLIYLPANSQISFGIKASHTKAWFSSDDKAKMDGLGTTVTFYKRLNKFLEIGIEPGLVQKGTSQIYGEYSFIMCCFGPCPLEDEPARKLKATYAQAPFMAQLRLPIKNSPFILTGKLGGGASYLTSGYYETITYPDFGFEGREKTKALDFNANDDLNRWDFGFHQSIGLGVAVGHGTIILETEFYQGLKKLTNYDDFKNRSRSFSLGYFIYL